MKHDADIAVLSSWHRETVWPDDRSHVLTARDFRRLAALLPSQVLLLASPVKNWFPQIDPAERAIVRNAVLRRQAEFSTGRMLASRALDELGMPATPIISGAMNEPVWPAGVAGSISHTTDTCMVALAATNELAGLGIDLEARRDAFREIGHLVLRKDEQDIGASVRMRREDVLRLVFSAKEALYKAVYARVERFIDFLEVRISVRPDTASFSATAPDDARLDTILQRGNGRFFLTKDHVFAAWCQNL